ncbi:MAG: cation transporter [Nitrospiraceae bacterium]|nr:cation transporter [Nitrospiraceae bacterium]
MANITIQIDGMSCQHCVMRVKKALEGLNGVTGANVTVGQAEVSFDESTIQTGDIKGAITKAGYRIKG